MFYFFKKFSKQTKVVYENTESINRATDKLKKQNANALVFNNFFFFVFFYTYLRSREKVKPNKGLT